MTMMENCLGYKTIETELKHTEGLVNDYKKWLLNNFKYFTKVNVEESKKVADENKAEIKQCYHNCFKALASGRFKYFEGYTWTEKIPIPLEHSWLVKNDLVIDPTLIIDVRNIKNRLGDEYLGVEIPIKYVIQKAFQTRKTGAFIFDYYIEKIRNGGSKWK